jgi:hypothetical protein
MNMKTILMTIVLMLCCGTAMAAELVYEGTWLTTNRKLDGTMTCVVTDKGKDKWQGRFYGIWQGVKFDYKVDWSGPPEKMIGKAMIDGANYEWTGEMTPETPGTFKGKFTGDRYTGSFDLKQKVYKKK